MLFSMAYTYSDLVVKFWASRYQFGSLRTKQTFQTYCLFQNANWMFLVASAARWPGLNYYKTNILRYFEHIVKRKKISEEKKYYMMRQTNVKQRIFFNNEQHIVKLLFQTKPNDHFLTKSF